MTNKQLETPLPVGVVRGRRFLLTSRCEETAANEGKVNYERPRALNRIAEEGA